jgi:IS4 transposase
MNKEKIIYSLSVEDIFTVIEDNNWNIKIKKEDIPFIEEKVGDMINWRGAIEFALCELKDSRKKLQTK